MSAWIRPLQFLANLILPGGCMLCERHLTPGEGPWCIECALKLGRAVAAPYCPRCGLTVSEPANLADGCQLCRIHPVAYDGIARVGEYDRAIRDIVLRYKFGGQQRLDRPMSEMLASAIQAQPWSVEIEALVPVPTSWGRRTRHGFSPVSTLAAGVGRQLRLPVLPLVVQRARRRSQVGLEAVERIKNAQGKYGLRRGARPADGIFCIIDDVSTTGGTLQDMVRTLTEAGASRVYAAVVGKTDPARAHELRA